MSAAPSTAGGAAPARAVDLTPTAVATGVVAAAGPVAVGAIQLVLPYRPVDEPVVAVTAALAHPGATSAVLTLAPLIALTLPVGVLVAGRLARARRPVLGTVGAVLAWCGAVLMSVVPPTEQLATAGAAAGLTPAQVVALDDGLGAHPAAGAATVLMIVGLLLGTSLLGVALWGAIPRVLAVGLVGAQPLLVVVMVAVPSAPAAALLWFLVGTAFAACALVWPTAQRR